MDSPGLSLDRSIYPAGAQVHVTIEDNRLNIDPTSDDIWTWNTAAEPVVMYYMVDVMLLMMLLTVTQYELYHLLVISITAAAFVATAACGDCALLIDPNTRNDYLAHDTILELTSLNDLPIRATVDAKDARFQIR